MMEKEDYDVVRAYNLVRRHCEEQTNCNNCILYSNDDDDCRSQMGEPHEWPNFDLTREDAEKREEVASPPSHYDGAVQPIELMQAQMSPEAFMGFLRGNIIKYAARFGRKGKSIDDAKKIRQYAEWLVQMTERGEIEVEHKG